MATATGRNHCVTCGKDKATLRCGGCLQEFCFNHSADHRQELSKQLDEVEVTRDLFRQRLTDETVDPQKHAMMQQINDWERDSSDKIRQTADEARKQLLKYTTEHIEQIENNLTTLTERLRQCREENDFYETDIRHWNEELKRLTNELGKPSNINLQQDTTSLINNISIDIISGPPAVSKRNDNTGGSAKGFNTLRTNSNDENSNPNSGRGFGSRSGGGNIGFGDRGRRGGFGGGSGSSNDGSSRACYNCNQTGHMDRECPVPRTQNRGDFSSGSGSSNDGSSRACYNCNQTGHMNRECPVPRTQNRVGFSAGSGSDSFNSDVFNLMGNIERKFGLRSLADRDNASLAIRFRNSRYPNEDDQADVNPTFTIWRSGVGIIAPNGNDPEESSKRTAVHNLSMRLGFNDGGGVRDGRGGGGGGFSSGNRDNRGGGAGDGGNCYNCNQPGHQSRECPEPKTSRDDGGSTLFSGDYDFQNADMRSASGNFGSRTQASAPNGGTASADAAENA